MDTPNSGYRPARRPVTAVGGIHLSGPYRGPVLAPSDVAAGRSHVLQSGNHQVVTPPTCTRPVRWIPPCHEMVGPWRWGHASTISSPRAMGSHWTAGTSPGSRAEPPRNGPRGAMHA